MKKAHFFEAADPSSCKGKSGEIDVEKWQAASRLIL